MLALWGGKRSHQGAQRPGERKLGKISSVIASHCSFHSHTNLSPIVVQPCVPHERTGSFPPVQGRCPAFLHCLSRVCTVVVNKCSRSPPHSRCSPAHQVLLNWGTFALPPAHLEISPKDICVTAVEMLLASNGYKFECCCSSVSSQESSSCRRY